MKHLRNKVLAFLQKLPEQSHEQFNEAFEFYKQSPAKNKGQESNYNRIGYGNKTLKNLLYDLQKIYEISDLEVLSPLEISEIPIIPIIPIVPIIPIQKDSLFEEFPLDVTGIIAEGAGSEFKEELQPIRQEFPFLNDKDCPHVFYTIVGLRISKYKQYQELHVKLQKANSDEFGYNEAQKLQITSDCEAAFNENKKLWDELNYYNINKAILGKHPMFGESNIQKEVELMTNDDMYKFKASSNKFFHDQKKAITKNVGKVEKLDEINKKITDREYKLALINAKLGIKEDDKK
jgi:hypothetical protein